jgi:hypothetical protein
MTDASIEQDVTISTISSGAVLIIAWVINFYQTFLLLLLSLLLLPISQQKKKNPVE